MGTKKAIDIEKLKELLLSGYSRSAIANELGVSRRTLYTFMKTEYLESNVIVTQKNNGENPVINQECENDDSELKEEEETKQSDISQKSKILMELINSLDDDQEDL